MWNRGFAKVSTQGSEKVTPTTFTRCPPQKRSPCFSRIIIIIIIISYHICWAALRRSGR